MSIEISERFCVCGEVGAKYCSDCRVSKYCGKECQVNDWDEHKRLCGKLKEEKKKMNYNRVFDKKIVKAMKTVELNYRDDEAMFRLVKNKRERWLKHIFVSYIREHINLIDIERECECEYSDEDEKKYISYIKSIDYIPDLFFSLTNDMDDQKIYKSNELSFLKERIKRRRDCIFVSHIIESYYTILDESQEVIIYDFLKKIHKLIEKYLSF